MKCHVIIESAKLLYGMLMLKGIFRDFFFLQVRTLRPEDSDLPVVIQLVSRRSEPSMSFDGSFDS